MMAASTSAAYPPHRPPPSSSSSTPYHKAQSQSSSSVYAPSLQSRPSGNQGGGQPFKPMYDLPPGFHQQSQSVGGSSGGGSAVGGGASLPQRGGAGGLNRLRSPPPLPHAERGSPGGAGGLSASTSSVATMRTASQTPPLVQPQPRRQPASPSLLHTSSSSPPPASIRSPTPGSVSIFSKAPQNPSSPSPRDIALFSEHCRRVFFDNDGQSQRYVEQVLRSIPPSHKAAFIREQSRVRQDFHHSASLRRRMEFDALLASTTSGGALTIKGRREPRGAVAKRERRDRLKRFLDTHAGKNNIGPAPLLSALAAVLRLQAQADKKGGAGGSRVEWEIDDAVWMECGGKDFMIDALAVVKGVLGFEDVPRPRTRRRSEPSLTVLRSPLQPPSTSAPFMRSTLSRNSSAESSPPPAGHSSPDQSSPFLSNSSGRKRGKAPPPPPTAASASYDPNRVADPLRPRASSDPFSDARNNTVPASAGRPAPATGGRSANRRGPAPPVPVRHPFQPTSLANGYEPAISLKDRTFSHGSAVSGTTELELMTPGAEDHHLLSSAVEDDDEDSDGALTDSSEDDDGFDLLGGSLSSPRWRTWLAPTHLTNPELADLLRLFPKHLARPSKPARFPYLGPGQTALEEGSGTARPAGGDGRSQGKGVVECAAWQGTGRVWKGSREREPGWAGTGWDRFVGWWKALFS